MHIDEEIPLEKKLEIYMPEMLYGTIGGCESEAVLTNIFSLKFEVEIIDGVINKKYNQIFQNNMKEKGEPEIVEHAGELYTKIKYWP